MASLTSTIGSATGALLARPVRPSGSSFLGQSVSTPLDKTRPFLPARSPARASLGVAQDSQKPALTQVLRTALCGACAALALAGSSPAIAASSSGPKLPPLSKDPQRCEKAFVGNTIGQANGVADKLLDLRGCDFTGDTQNLKGKTLSAALMSGAKFDRADMSEAILTKAFARDASFKGTDFTSAVVDRVSFDGSDMQGVIFRNTVLSGATFEGANLKGAVFEDALLGYIDAQKLCKNPTLEEETIAEIGCFGNR